jgi:hypothetical protein
VSRRSRRPTVVNIYLDNPQLVIQWIDEAVSAIRIGGGRTSETSGNSQVLREALL